MVGQLFSYLGDDEVLAVHKASLEILEDVGFIVRNEKARDRFAEHGAIVEHNTELVKIPSHIVERYRALIPPTITLRGRDPACDVTLPREAPVVATASSAPDIVDPVSQRTRRSTSHDIANIAKLVNELEGIDVFRSRCWPTMRPAASSASRASIRL